MTLEDLQLDTRFNRCASSELLNAKAEVFFNPEDVEYYLIVDDDDELTIGPLTKSQMEAMLHAGKDAYEDHRTC